MPSWNFHFNHNISEREASESAILLNMFDSIHMTAQPDCQTWTLDSSSTYTCKSFYDYLITKPNDPKSSMAKAFL